MPRLFTDYRQMLEILTDNRHWDPSPPVSLKVFTEWEYKTTFLIWSLFLSSQNEELKNFFSILLKADG